MSTIQSSAVIDKADDILASQYNDLRSDILAMLVSVSTEVTVSTGAISYTAGQTFYRVDTEGDGAADDLDTINGGSEGDIIVLVLENDARVVTIKHNADNIQLGGNTDIVLGDGRSATLIMLSGGDWLEIMRGEPTPTSLPSGLIVLHESACPSGWTRFAALDGKYPRGNAAYGGTGGAASHTHDYTEIEEHTHAAGTLETDSAGAHYHTVATGATAASGKPRDDVTNVQHTATSSSDGSHTHTLTGTVADTGGAAATNSSGAIDPPYLEMVYCKKD